MMNHRPESFRQRRTGTPQFIPVKNRKAMKQILAVRCQLDQYFAPVLIARAAFYCAVIDQAVHQFHRAVVAQAEPL